MIMVNVKNMVYLMAVPVVTGLACWLVLATVLA